MLETNLILLIGMAFCSGMLFMIIISTIIDRERFGTFFFTCILLVLFYNTYMTFDNIISKKENKDIGVTSVYRKLAERVDDHRLFRSMDIVDQRALLLGSQVNVEGPKGEEIDNILYREFRAGSLDSGANWKGLYTMFADYLEAKP